MKKRILMIACSIMLTCASVVGCLPGALTSQNSTVAEAAKKTTKKNNKNTTKKNNKKKKTPSASKLADAVKTAYGENYLPNYQLSAEEIQNLTGVSADWYASAYVAQPMISVHIDTLMIFKAKNAKSKKKILNKIKAYQTYLIEDTMQYPSNQYKIKGSTIYTNGNYVCFIMLGQIDLSIEQTGDESKIIAAYQTQNKKAVTAIKKKLKG